jgi:Putative prokaryotic signal transducing protein
VTRDPWDGDELRQRARKVDPRYREGPLVTVTAARNLTEAEFVQGLLLEEGIPSMLRRSRGFDVPDFLAAGPRDVLVPRSGYEAAREVLLQAELVGDPPPSIRPAAVLLWLVAGVALIAIIALLAS